MPRGINPGRPPVWTRRQLINGIRWRTRTGAPWRDVPERYGPWDRVYDLFRRWQRDGTWARIVTQLQAEAAAKGLITWEVNVDPPSAGPTSTRPGRRKGGPAKGTARRQGPRTGRPWPRALPGRADHQDSPRRRAGPKRDRDHGRRARSPRYSNVDRGRRESPVGAVSRRRLCHENVITVTESEPTLVT
ncbi:transposase [Streptomyces sp. NPDC051105]|uniref:transposase n=1 Tax=Streptomyces sp. NPDC051105 TaxID=3154843 RepID=UPI0034147CCF